MTRKALAVALALVVGLLGLGLGTAQAVGKPAADPELTGSTVFIGTGGLRWSDVTKDATPNLWVLLRDGSSAALSIRSVETNTCPVDGWLGLSAGARAAAPRPGKGTAQDKPCPALPSVSDGEVDGWAGYLKAAAGRKFNSELGLLGDVTTAGGECVQAVGPGAAAAAATKTGAVPNYASWDANTLLTDLAACPLVLVDAGSLRDPDDVADGETAPASRDVQVAAIDARIGQVIAAGPNGANYIVASLSDAGRQEGLRLVVARGPDFGPGELVSPSTKQRGLAQAQDLTATLIALAGDEVPASLGGARLTSDPAQDNSETRALDRLQGLVDYDESSFRVHSLVEPFFMVFAYGQLVIYLFVLLVWKGRIGSEATRVRSLGWVRVVAVSAASVPASTFLANLLPWWRFPIPMLAVVGSVALFVTLIAGVALHGPWSHKAVGPMAVVSGTTMTVLAVDVLTGSRLQLSSLMGLQPVVAGRFYGMGNVTFALFATSTILLAIALTAPLVASGQRRLAAIVAGTLGVVAVVIDGAPFWGADGGGPPALIPGMAVFVLSILGISLTWQRIAMIAGASVGLFALVAFLDWLRPAASQSHLGRFVQAILDGDALDIVVRKGEQNLRILTGNMPLTLLVPAALAFVIYVLARPTSWGSRSLQHAFDSVPTLRPGLIGLLVTLTIGFLINDSGVAIPAVGATVAVPLIVSVAVRSLVDEAQSGAPTRASRRTRR